MLQCVIIILCIQNATDNLVSEPTAKKNYTKQVLINGVIGIGFGSAAVFFHVKGNNAYENYEQSNTFTEALDNWNKTITYDIIRDACAVGGAVFLIRALVFQLKNVKTKMSSQLKFDPTIDYEFSPGLKISFGIGKTY